MHVVSEKNSGLFAEHGADLMKCLYSRCNDLYDLYDLYDFYDRLICCAR